MAFRRRTRMYEPWGYQDQNNYQGSEIIHENDLDSFFSGVQYKRDDNKIHFTNKDGEEVAYLDVNEFVKSDSIIEKTEYNDGILKVYFTNGDIVTIDLTELLDENEFKDGLTIDGHVVKVLVDSESEDWLSVSENGVKIYGIQPEIDRLDGKIDNEIARATGEEERIEGKLDQEIQDRKDDVDEEENRAKAAEQILTTNLNNEITRATRTEQSLENNLRTVSENLSSEITRAQAAEQLLTTNLTSEVNNRVAAVTAERNRAEAAETALQGSIADEGRRAQEAESALTDAFNEEVERATAAEEELSDRIDEIISGSPVERLDELIEKLGYKDNDTLQTTNEHEVAFGKWNVSNTDVEPSGQTIFSIGIGTSAHDRKNALEVRKDGSIWATVENDYVDITKILGQLVHEVYDEDSTNP